MTDIAIQYYTQLHSLISAHAPTKGGLLSGALGLALYHYTVYKVSGKHQDAEKTVGLIESILADTNEGKGRLVGTSLGSGTAGLGYVLTILQQDGLIALDLDDKLAALDLHLFQTALQQINSLDAVDFLHGAMGVVHYFTLRLPSKTIHDYLTQLIEAFCKHAMVEPEGIWFRNMVHVGKDEDRIDLGLSHGLCGFLLVLIAAAEKGIDLPVIRNTVEDGTNFIMHYKKEVDFLKDDFTFYPSYIYAKNKAQLVYPKSMGWCYGDLNMALLFIRAGQFLEYPGWVKFGNTIGTATFMRKTIADIDASDTHFCHGTSGVAQFYKHLYQLTGVDVYKTAWHYWINETLQLLPAELELGLYKGKEGNLLEGLPGISLVLLSYLSNHDLLWSKALLI